MENATKALLIAAAVLVAIIIISLTLSIVNQGQDAVAGADLSEAEAAQFNAKFKAYEGSNISTAQVNSLLNDVFSHNKNEYATGDARYVAISVYSGTSTAGSATASISTSNVSTITSVPRVSGSNYYKVTCKYTGTIITSIAVTKVN